MTPIPWMFYLIPNVLLAAALGLILFLYVEWKRELWRIEKQWEERIKSLAAQVSWTRSAIGELSERAGDAEKCLGMLPPPALPAAGLNLNRRTQAMRLSRRGERPEQIAAALSLPRNEVELLVKVQRILLGPN